MIVYVRCDIFNQLFRGTSPGPGPRAPHADRTAFLSFVVRNTPNPYPQNRVYRILPSLAASSLFQVSVSAFSAITATVGRLPAFPALKVYVISSGRTAAKRRRSTTASPLRACRCSAPACPTSLATWTSRSRPPERAPPA